MGTTALDVADTLIQCIAIEANRLLEKLQSGEADALPPLERMALRKTLCGYLEALRGPAADELRMLTKVDLQKIETRTLERILGPSEKAPDVSKQ